MTPENRITESCGVIFECVNTDTRIGSAGHGQVTGISPGKKVIGTKAVDETVAVNHNDSSAVVCADRRLRKL